MKNDPRSCEYSLCNCIRRLKKLRTSTGFEPISLRYRCNSHSSFDLISKVLYDLFHIHLSQKCLCYLYLQKAQLLLLRGTNMKSIKCPAKEGNGRRKVKGVKWENAKEEKSASWVCLHLESRQSKTKAIIDLNL